MGEDKLKATQQVSCGYIWEVYFPQGTRTHWCPASWL